MEQPKINMVAIIGLAITSVLFFAKITNSYAKLESRLSVIEWKLGQTKEELNDLKYTVNQNHKRDKN